MASKRREERDRKIDAMLAEGRSHREIRDALGVGFNTISARAKATKGAPPKPAAPPAESTPPAPAAPAPAPDESAPARGERFELREPDPPTTPAKKTPATPAPRERVFLV